MTITEQSALEAKYVVPEKGISALRSRYLAWRNKDRWKRFLGKRYGTQSSFITDATGSNASGRVETRVGGVIGRDPIFIPITYPNQLEAAGNLIDQLDAFEDREGIIFVNVAPRSVKGEQNGNKEENENGTPFCHFKVKNVLVVASADGLTLSLIKKFGLAKSFRVIDTLKALAILRSKRLISKDEEKDARPSQFRSYVFLPKVGAYLLRHGSIRAAAKKDIRKIPDAPPAAWWVDYHGNVKTTLIAEEVFSPEVIKELESDRTDQITTLATAFGTLPVYRRLKDVPDDIGPAIVVGSSALIKRRFLEIVIQGGSAAKKLGVSVGDVVLPR